MENSIATNCLNCETKIDVEDAYCRHCGQRNTTSRLKLREVISQFMGDYFAFDSALWQSLKLLFLKPGKLTKEFIAGKRKTYISPFRLYIFSSFIYFLVLAFSSKPITQDSEPFLKLDMNPESTGIALDIDSLSAQRAITDTSFIKIEPGSDMFVEHEGSSAIQEFFIAQANKVNKNPELFMNSLVREVSIAMFFMLPIFGALLLIFHYKREPYYVSHIIHGIHIHAFLFALFTLTIIENFITDWIGLIGGTCVSFLYLIISLKQVYRQKLWVAILKSFFIALLYLALLIIASIVVLLIAVALA